jgi:outer membrane protein OmpA-like peptidoglycan-associated protein
VDVLPNYAKGTYVLQLNVQSQTKEVITHSLGVTLRLLETTVVKPVTPTKKPTKKKYSAVLPFAYAKTSILSKQLKLLKTLDLTAKAPRITIVGYAQRSGRDDLKFSQERAQATKRAILRIAPKAKVSVVASGSKYNSLCKASNNRCVIVKVVK